MNTPAFNYILLPLAFLFELLICESIFLIGMKHRRHFALRSALTLPCMAAAALLTNWLFAQLPSNVMARTLFFLTFFSWSILAIWACFQMDIGKVLFVAIAGYSVQHVADSLVKIFMELVDTTSLSLTMLILLLTLPYALIAALFYCFLVKRARLDEEICYNDGRVLAVSAINLVFCLLLSVVMDDLSLPSSAIIVGKIYAMLGCLLCLLLQMGLFQNRKMEQTNRTLQQMMLMERKQHLISKETIELINMKCHDLKHQIGKLEQLNEEKRGRSIEELSRAILIYDGMIKTGCAALDTVLMEKKLLFDKYHIQFSYMGDATGLDRLDEVDIYSLFGNMLDNAIESLQCEPDEEKRIITLNIHTHMRMLYICMDNYCSTPVVYRDGEIQTTKQNEPGLHGYGVKSIAYIVNTHNGNLLIKTENHHFTLEIMLPDNGMQSVSAVSGHP